MGISDNKRLTPLSHCFNSRQIQAFARLGLNTVGDLSGYMDCHKPNELLMVKDIAEDAIYTCIILLGDSFLPYHKDYDRWLNLEYMKTKRGVANMTRVAKRRKHALDNGVAFTYGRAGRMQGAAKTSFERERENILLEKSERFIKHYFSNGYDPIQTCLVLGYSKNTDYATACFMLSHHREKLKAAGIYPRVLRELGMEPDDMRDRAISHLGDALNAVKHEWIGRYIERDQASDLRKIAPGLTDEQVAAILNEHFIISKVFKMSIEVPDHKARTEAVKVMASMFPQRKADDSGNVVVPNSPEEALDRLIDQTERMLMALRTKMPDVVEDYIEKLRRRFVA